MAFGFDIGRILEQYGSSPQSRVDQAEQDFDEVSQHADPDQMQEGISEAFRSDRTPPFGSMVSQLFNQADTGQRTGMLNQLLGGIGPSVIASLMGGRGSGLGSLLGGGTGAGILGSLLGKLNAGDRPELSPQEVEQLSPQQVEQIATEAEKENPGIIDQMSRFYAQNPTLIKALGGAALAIALGKMAERNRH